MTAKGLYLSKFFFNVLKLKFCRYVDAEFRSGFEAEFDQDL